MTTAALDRPSRARTLALRWLAVAVVAGTAALAGAQAGTGAKGAVVLPLAAVAVLGLAVLACVDFQSFVIVLLVVRAGLDVARLSGSAAGNTATNSVASKGADPSSLVAVLFLLAATLWLVAQYRARGRLPGSTLRRCFILLAAAGFLSVLGSARPSVSAVEALRVLASVMMFVVLEQLMQREDGTRRLVGVALLSAVFPITYTLVGIALGTPPSESKFALDRLTGPFTQSNIFGRYLMLMIVMGVALYPRLGRRARIAVVAATPVAATFLLLTYTRTALVGAVLGLLVVGLVQSKRLLISLALACVLALIAVPGLGARFAELSDTSISTQGSSDGNSLTWRLSYWTDVLPLANANPVTGIGLNMTQYNTDAAKQPHNDLIRAYVETGVIGLVAYVALICSMVATGVRAVRRAPPRSFDRSVGAGFLGCAAAFVADSLFANVISNVVSLWYLAAFAAAGAAVARRHPRVRRPAPQPRPAEA